MESALKICELSRNPAGIVETGGNGSFVRKSTSSRDIYAGKTSTCRTLKTVDGGHPVQLFIHGADQYLPPEAGDVVLDPFAGSGTTLKVARRLQRSAIGIEIIPEYVLAMNESLRENVLLL